MTQQFMPLAQGLVLVSWWIPLIVVALFSGWAWAVSTIYDKDAAKFYLPRRTWNLAHIGAGATALAVVALVPLPWFVTIPVAFGILLTDLIVYFIARNQDDRVPANMKWTLDLSRIREMQDAKKKAKKSASSTMLFKGPKGEVPVPGRDAPEFEIRTGAESLIVKLSELRGTQIDFAPLKDGSYGIAAMIDGVRQPLEAMPAPTAIAMMDLFKTAAGLDIQDRRRKQQGDFKFGSHDPSAPLTVARVVSMGSAAGMQLTVLVDPEGQVSRKIEELGLHPNQLEDLKRLIKEQSGVVLLAAPPDNGRTSTFYALIRAHDAYTSNVQTIELDPQTVIEGVRQNRFDPKVDGAEYSTTVRSILRRDPDVVGVAEMPDENTAKEVARADFDRTRVYFALPTDGALITLQMYAKAVGDQKTAARGLHGVVAQRLLRKLCENCRVAFQPTPDMLKKLGLPPDTRQLYRKGGQVLIKDKPVACPVCGGSGFFGQIGVFEVYTIDAQGREMLAQNDLTALRASFRQKKQQSIQQAALMHAIAGNTSVEEVVRITQPATPPRPQAEAQAAAPAAAAPPKA